MKVDYISDIHADFWWKSHGMDGLCKELSIKGGDVLIIAGDLGHYFSQDTVFLKHVNTIYDHVMLVTGNHDLYLVSNKQVQKYKSNSFNRIEEMKEFCKAEGIHYLDGDVVEVDGIKFGGVGMSWDDSYFQILTGNVPSKETLLSIYKTNMNDSRVIHGIDPFEFFEQEYNKLKNIGNVDVMISHYSPVVPPKMRSEFRCSPSTTFYYFDGRSEVNRINPKYWIFGHTHDSHSFKYGGTKLLCNPLGYPFENTYARVKTFGI